MFHSQSLSRKGPLGSIWVAAYCHKRLKKAQVTATDIPFSVDKILQDDFEVITCRILGYFLLGVVRIYSKKVEYLFNDCHKVLIQVKGFVVSEKRRSCASKSKVFDVPISLITLPKRFELDAFDLEVGEDASGAHEMPQEEITLKDNAWMYEGMRQYAMQECKWEDVAGSHDICLTDYTEAEETILMDYMDAETGVERPRLSMFSQEESAGFLAFDHQSRPYNKDNQAEGEHMRNHEGAFLAEKDKCFSEDEHDLRNLEATVEKLQEVGELEIRNASSEAGALSEGDKFLANEDHDVNLDTTFERLREDGKFAKEKRDFNVASLLDGETRELRGAETTVSFATEEANKPSEIVLFESPEHDVVMKDHSLSLRIDSTPPTKLPNIAQGGPTPEFMLISTPTPKERPQTKRKRMCLFDDLIVLPNDLIKKNLRDASDLVCKRRKAPRNAFTAWKATRALGFSEPLIPYSSSELWSLHYEMNLKISEPCEDVQVPEKVESSEPPSGDGSLQQAGIAPETPVRQPSEPPSGDGSLQQAGIAPETPVRQSSSRRPFESPKASKEIRLESPYDSVTLEKEPLAEEDHGLDFALMHEDMKPLEEGTHKLNGWTGRSRTVAGHLNKVFRKQKREGVAVLQSKGYIDVEQETAYTDVLIRKLPKWEQSFDADNNSKQCA